MCTLHHPIKCSRVGMGHLYYNVYSKKREWVHICRRSSLPTLSIQVVVYLLSKTTYNYPYKLSFTYCRRLPTLSIQVVVYLLSKMARILISLMAISAANTSDTVW